MIKRRLFLFACTPLLAFAASPRPASEPAEAPVSKCGFTFVAPAGWKIGLASTKSHAYCAWTLSAVATPQHAEPAPPIHFTTSLVRELTFVQDAGFEYRDGTWLHILEQHSTVATPLNGEGWVGLVACHPPADGSADGTCFAIALGSGRVLSAHFTQSHAPQFQQLASTLRLPQ